MNVLVTGADGFVGRHLTARLIEAGHQVTGACRPGGSDDWRRGDWGRAVRTVPLELTDGASVAAAVRQGQPDAVIHLAAVAYSPDAQADPVKAWDVNVTGTAHLLRSTADRRPTGSEEPIVVVASSAEVYGEGEARPRVETDVPRPHSVYSWTKVGAELAAGYAIRAWGLRVIVVRPFPATGPGQTHRVIPNWIAALRKGEPISGDPTIVRDYIDVRDMAEAYLAILGGGRPGETYNIATGREVRFGELAAKLGRMVGADGRLVPPLKPRAGLQHLVGNPRKLQEHTGWQPTIRLERTLEDLIADAEAH